jgi:hypothetical protein
MGYAWNASSQEAQAGGSWVQGQPDYLAGLCLKKTKQKSLSLYQLIFLAILCSQIKEARAVNWFQRLPSQSRTNPDPENWSSISNLVKD